MLVRLYHVVSDSAPVAEASFAIWGKKDKSEKGSKRSCENGSNVTKKRVRNAMNQNANGKSAFCTLVPGGLIGM